MRKDLLSILTKRSNNCWETSVFKKKNHNSFLCV